MTRSSSRNTSYQHIPKIWRMVTQTGNTFPLKTDIPLVCAFHTGHEDYRFTWVHTTRRNTRWKNSAQYSALAELALVTVAHDQGPDLCKPVRHLCTTSTMSEWYCTRGICYLQTTTKDGITACGKVTTRHAELGAISERANMVDLDTVQINALWDFGIGIFHITWCSARISMLCVNIVYVL